MYPTGSCQKYSSSTAGKGTRLKAVKITTERFAVWVVEGIKMTGGTQKI